MSPNTTQDSTPLLIDLTGLPGPVVQQVRKLVEYARQMQEAETVSSPTTSTGRHGVIGMFAHLGIQTPTLEKFEHARRETWANFPLDFPDQPQ